MQIYRKLWHLSFIWAPIAYYHWLSTKTVIILSIVFLLVFLVLDLIRLNWRRGNEIAYRYFSWLLREQERKGFNTAIYFSLACLICAVFFEKKVAVLAITLLCVGDPVAAFIGSTYGTIRILNKSLQGSLACFVACFLVAQFMFDLTIAFWAALTATFFELISSRLNDNLSIPIFSGLMVTSLLQSPTLTGPMQYFLIFLRVYFVFVIVTSLVGLGVKHYIVHFYLRNYSSTFTPVRGWLPSISIVKPVCGLEGGDYENFASFARLHYDGPLEILFVAADRSDPALRVIDQIRVRFPEKKISTVVCGKSETTTDKMNKLIHGARRARGEVLIFSDASARVDPGYLDRILDPLSDDRIGLVTAVAAYFGARNIPAALNSHLVNMLGQSLYYGLAYFDRLESANGCTVALRRSVYDEVGGFEAVRDQISDPHALAQAVHKRNYKIHLLDEMIPVYHPKIGFLEWLRKVHRMVVTYYTYVPHLYPLFIFQLGVFHGLLYWWMSPSSIVPPLLVSLSVAGEIVSHLRMNYLYVRDRSTYLFIWLLPLLLACAPLLWVSPYFSKVVTWRGQRYFVDKEGIATRLKQS
jgi:ceramide glucosyltransferase